MDGRIKKLEEVLMPILQEKEMVIDSISYEKEGKYYNVYSISDSNKKQRTFLFKTSDLNSVTYLDGYIYFKKDNSYYYYSPKGIRKLIENSEMNFNDTLKFGVYEK